MPEDSNFDIHFHEKNLILDYDVAKIVIFCHVMHCTLIEGYCYYGGTYCSILIVEMTH
jgi:hypothetical protein